MPKTIKSVCKRVERPPPTSEEMSCVKHQNELTRQIALKALGVVLIVIGNLAFLARLTGGPALGELIKKNVPCRECAMKMGNLFGALDVTMRFVGESILLMARETIPSQMQWYVEFLADEMKRRDQLKAAGLLDQNIVYEYVPAELIKKLMTDGSFTTPNGVRDVDSRWGMTFFHATMHTNTDVDQLVSNHQFAQKITETSNDMTLEKIITFWSEFSPFFEEIIASGKLVKPSAWTPKVELLNTIHDACKAVMANYPGLSFAQLPVLAKMRIRYEALQLGFNLHCKLTGLTDKIGTQLHDTTEGQKKLSQAKSLFDFIDQVKADASTGDSGSIVERLINLMNSRTDENYGQSAAARTAAARARVSETTFPLCFTLMWNSKTDLDLYIYFRRTPNGEREIVYYGKKGDKTFVFLDQDANFGKGNAVMEPAENVSLSPNAMLYDVSIRVHNYCIRSESTTSFELFFRLHGKELQFPGAASGVSVMTGSLKEKSEKTFSIGTLDCAALIREAEDEVGPVMNKQQAALVRAGKLIELLAPGCNAPSFRKMTAEEALSNNMRIAVFHGLPSSVPPNAMTLEDMIAAAAKPRRHASLGAHLTAAVNGARPKGIRVPFKTEVNLDELMELVKKGAVIMAFPSGLDPGCMYKFEGLSGKFATDSTAVVWLNQTTMASARDYLHNKKALRLSHTKEVYGQTPGPVKVIAIVKLSERSFMLVLEGYDFIPESWVQCPRVNVMMLHADNRKEFGPLVDVVNPMSMKVEDKAGLSLFGGVVTFPEPGSLVQSPDLSVLLDGREVKVIA